MPALRGDVRSPSAESEGIRIRMTRNDGRRRFARLALTAGITTVAAVTGVAGTAYAGTPGALPQGTVRIASADGITGSYIVVLRSTAAAKVATTATGLVLRYGGTVVQDYSATVHGFHAELTPTQAARLAANPAVDYVEQDATVRLAEAGTEYNPGWGLDRIDQRSLPYSKTYSFSSAAGVTAYVLDTGIRITHDEFGGRARYGRDFIDNDSTAQDCNGHGTHVSATIGGRTYGVAKDVKLVGVRILDCQGMGSYSAIIAGIDWVTRNAVKPAVANMSVGGTASTALNNAVTRSIASGVTYVVAAGNDNRNACKYSPASASAAITVGATDSHDKRASFSNYGSCVDLFAPGTNIASAYNRSNTSAAYMSGTSMATPHVTGAAALLLGSQPGFSPQQVTAALLDNATTGRVTSTTGSPNRELYTGFLNPSGPADDTDCGPYTSDTTVALAKKGTATSTIDVTDCTGTASAKSSVTVSVGGATRGSLVITLTSPQGVRYTLKTANKSDTTAGLAQSYPINLSALDRAGKWTLRVTDAYGTTAGTLNGWKLTL
jgi:subtilisin family serine protease